MKQERFLLSALFLLLSLNSQISFADSYFNDYPFSGSSYYGGSYGGSFGGKHQFSVTSMNSDIEEQINASFRIAVREDRGREVHRILEEKKVDVNSQSEDGMTALMYASRNCSSEITKALLNNHADVNIQDSKGRTALMYAIVDNCKPVSILLCQNTKLNLDLKDELGRTAQDYASAELALDYAGSAAEIHKVIRKTSSLQKRTSKKKTQVQG
jgi:ankyrin repeat protein